MLNKEEIEALELCVGIAIGEAGSGTQTDLAIEAIEKLKAAQHSVHPTLLACGHPATAIDPYDNSCLICRHEKRG